MAAVNRKKAKVPEGFWSLVRAAMTRVYEADAGRVTRMRNRVRAMDYRKQLLFYHLDPLSVAANLSGKAISDSDVEGYRSLPEWREYAGLEAMADIVLTEKGARAPAAQRGLTKDELTRKVASETSVSLEQTGKVISATLNEIRSLLGSGRLVTLGWEPAKTGGRAAKRKDRSKTHVPIHAPERA